MKHLAIYASGQGSNARAIIDYFRKKHGVKVECIICNNPKAGVIAIAKENKIPCYVISRADLYQNNKVFDLMKDLKIDLIVLAGFLWKIPENILHEFPNKIINIHPALLPKYGGAGMYGARVHEAVIKNGEKESGITIHYVNENYDEGEIIFRKKIAVSPSDDAESIAEKIHVLEHEWYPKIIERLLSS